MGRLTGRIAVPALLGVLALGTAACGGGAGATSGGDAAVTKDTAPKKITTQRWPRYWATVDSAEAGADDALSTAYFAGYDDTSVVYTGQDVIRFLDRRTGKQRKQVVLKGNRLVCTSQPHREIENGTVLIGTGVDEVGGCDTLEAYDSATGRLRWTYGTRGKGGEMTIDQRDGVVLFGLSPSAGDDGPGLLAGIDAKTGRQLWRRQAPDYFFDRPAKKDDECFVNPALAADRAVVVAFLGCSDFTDQRLPGLYGIDLSTGKQLWQTDFWDKPEYMYVSDGQKVHPHVDDGRTILASDVNTPVRVDSETGKVSPVTEPPPKKIEGHSYWWPACDDFRADDGTPGNHSDSCAFTNGDVVVFARDLSFGKKVRMRVEGVDAETGKSRWVWDRHEVSNPKKYEYHTFQFLGFDADRSEFWVLHDYKDIYRLDATTGRRVGQGLAAPPMELVNFAVPGPKFVLTRTAGGITSSDGSPVKSGLNFYATDAD